MRIAANTRFLFKDALEGFGVYTDQILKRIARDHPNDHIDCYFDREPSPTYKYGDNVTLHAFGPKARHPFLFYIWYQHMLKRRLDRSKQDVFFSPDGFMPLGLNMPTLLTIHDIAYARYPEHISARNRRYYEKNMPRFIQEAAHIVTVSNFSKREICECYDLSEDRVSVVYNGVSEAFTPRSEQQIELIRDKYAGGKSYFLYVGAIHPRKNIARLVASFDVFKRRSKSDMKLIIAGRWSWKNEIVNEALQRADSKSDIVLTGYIPDNDLPDLIGGAAALTYVSLYEGFGLPVVEAMASGVPVIVSNAGSTGAVLAEVAGDAAMAVDPNSIDSIAEGMIQMVTDITLRDTLVSNGLRSVFRFNWDSAANETYRLMQSCL